MLLIGTDLTNDLPVQWLRLRAAVTKRGAKLIVANPRATEPDRIAYHRLRHRPGAEAALLQGLLGAVLEQEQRDDGAPAGEAASLSPDRAAELTGVTAETIRAAAATLAATSNALVYVGPRYSRRSDQDTVAAAAYNLALATGNVSGSGGGVTFIPEGANSRGAERLGVVPGQDGLPAGEMIAAAAAGTIKCLYLVGENILETHPDRAQAEQALANAELVVVHELFETATAKAADVVLPGLSFAERDGTLTNVEGRVQRLGVAVAPEDGGLADWRILADLSGHFDAPLGYSSAAEITLEAFEDVITPAMMRRAAFPSEGVLLPAPEADGKPRFAAAPTAEPAAPGDGLRLADRFRASWPRDVDRDHATVAGHLAGAARRHQPRRRRPSRHRPRTGRQAADRARRRDPASAGERPRASRSGLHARQPRFAADQCTAGLAARGDHGTA